MHSNFMVLREEYKNMIPSRALYSMDFVAFIQNDGSYEIYKNRFNGKTRLKDHIEFLQFYADHLYDYQVSTL